MADLEAQLLKFYRYCDTYDLAEGEKNDLAARLGELKENDLELDN